MYELRTIANSTTTPCEGFNVGSDGLIHAKNGSMTVAAIPIGNVEGVFRVGGGA